MYILVLGHRRGITKALEKLGYSYLVWSDKPVKNKSKAEFVIQDSYPLQKNDLLKYKNELSGITHVIAGTESSVFPASQCRLWLKTRRVKRSIIRRCTDKLLMKRFLRDAGIPMTEFASGYSRDKNIETLKSIGTEVIAKPRESSGGYGQKRIQVKTLEDLPEDKELIFEKKITGQEGSVESFIEDGQIIFENQTEYVELGKYSFLPAQYSKELSREISSLNLKVISELGIQWGMTHLEYYITPEGVLFGEVALRPPGGYLMELMEIAYEVNMWDLFVKLELGEESIRELIPNKKQHAAAILYVPTNGVAELSSEVAEEIRSIPEVRKLMVKVKVGEKIPLRERTGQDWGYAILSSSDYDGLKASGLKVSRFLE